MKEKQLLFCPHHMYFNWSKENLSKEYRKTSETKIDCSISKDKEKIKKNSNQVKPFIRKIR